MQRSSLLLLVFFLFSASCAERVDLSEHKTKSNPSRDWKELLNSALGENEEAGLIDYEVIKAERRTLDRFLGWASEHGPEMDRMRESREDRRLAFLFNAHNAAVIHGVLRAGDIQSVLEVKHPVFRWRGGGFFSGQHYRVDGDWLSLNMLVEQSIVGRYQDPMLRFGVTQACVGCPPIRWWTSSSLDSQLKKNLKRWLNTPHGMQKAGAQGFKVNELFHQRRSDLLTWSGEESLCEWLKPYVGKKRRAWFKAHAQDCTLGTIEMDWALNAREG